MPPKVAAAATPTASSPASCTHYLINFVLILAAVLVGIAVQDNLPAIKQQLASTGLLTLTQHLDKAESTTITTQPTEQANQLENNEQLYKELVERIKNELKKEAAEIRQEPQTKTDVVKDAPEAKPATVKDDLKVATSKQQQQQKPESSDPIINEKPTETTTTSQDLNKANKKQENKPTPAPTPAPKTATTTPTAAPAKKVVIDDKPVKDTKSEIKFSNGEPITINPSSIKTNARDEYDDDDDDEDDDDEEVLPASNARKSNFPAVRVSKMKPKKMWIPIPNSNGGHRRCPAIEITAGKEHKSSVKVWLYEEFLSQDECKSLIDAHETHVKAMAKQKPIVCFDSVQTLRDRLVELKRDTFVELVSPRDFTAGTRCLNQTFSRQLEKWGLKWSYNTAFYQGESKFARTFGKLIEDATMLNETHGGRFLVTSYPPGVGLNEPTACSTVQTTPTSANEPPSERYAAFMVYLDELGADGGGENLFPEMGIDVKPRVGRALTWNRLHYESGKCETASSYQSAPVKHEVKRKHVIQRWYYYKTFAELGKRQPEATKPQRPANTPKVTCSAHEASCHMFDEWLSDHLVVTSKQSKVSAA